MIFGVATNEDRRQRSDKPKSRSPADLIYKASQNIRLYVEKDFSVYVALQYKALCAFLSPLTTFPLLIANC